jgi:outer membrane protein OmpA-like peptidoglycan-associated protein
LLPAVLRDTPTVAFPRGSAKLGPVATGQLGEVATLLREATDLKLSLVGHDAGGGKTVARLRDRRITSIKWFLIDRGIAPERIIVSAESSSDSDQVERIELRISQ